MYEYMKRGAVHLIQFTSPLKRDHAEEITSAIDRCFDQGQPQIVIDLENVVLMDSRGLELLVESQQRCLELGGCIKLAKPNELCRDILEATNVVSQFEVFDDHLVAVGSFAQ
ncbi:STAS domain-containing protein [Aporhodopirellula aestuarii]|uniref:STAS domain-containing protein n=1 Tax=Aporhodopirellula aestuarii TaxID=2950107 RepID=A0ABT0UAQ0_9BACT|nr:STAS domain-containing protein [Aporhodopirellula aestuarii]MCM2373600.1 STAS domain-containing protein [Aporhodopirellula aestuarii]